VDDISAAVCCANCGTAIQEVEPEGWWAGELDTMKQQVEEAECRVEEAQEALEDANERNVEMRATVRDAKRLAKEEADVKNNRIGQKLCDLTSVLSIMDDLIRSDGPPTREELSTLNDLRSRGGLPRL
jgi:hypothetical protein